MKAISIQQPWVHAILHEGKDVENRSWKSHFRGWLAIHSSRKPLRGCDQFPNCARVPPLNTLDYSAIVAIARLVDVRDAMRSIWFNKASDGETTFGWVLKDVHRLNGPISCKGMLGLWTVPTAIAKQIKKQFPTVNFGDLNNLTYRLARARSASLDSGDNDFDNSPEWSGDSRSLSKISLKHIKSFNARGMNRVYGRGDAWVRGRKFNMEIWRDRSGRLLVRFWSSNRHVDQQSFRILGQLSGPTFDEDWIPDILRERYDVFVVANFGQ